MAKSKKEKLVAAKALVAKLEAAIAAEAILSNVEVGNVVEFSYGRGAKARKLVGDVVAIRENEKGVKDFRVSLGHAFDQELYTIRATDILVNRSNPVETSDPLSAE
jgi:hypothetical protein